eukprot:5593794-Alexandrium_andersonii.AAC.1
MADLHPDLTAPPLAGRLAAPSEGAAGACKGPGGEGYCAGPCTVRQLRHMTEPTHLKSTAWAHLLSHSRLH